MWVAAISRRRAADFVQTVANIGTDIVLEFGFPFVYLRDVYQLKAAGAQHWWFDANHQTAREAFIVRNEQAIRERMPETFVPLEAFENYVSDIAAHQDEIHELFGPKIIETLKPDGTRLTVEQIHRQVLAGSTWKATTLTPTKVGRNDPSWCGSGKKFKRCHGSKTATH